MCAVKLFGFLFALCNFKMCEKTLLTGIINSSPSEGALLQFFDQLEQTKEITVCSDFQTQTLWLTCFSVDQIKIGECRGLKLQRDSQKEHST